jgi:hypothetical protein
MIELILFILILVAIYHAGKRRGKQIERDTSSKNNELR